MVETRFFDLSFVTRLLHGLGADVDARTTGVLVRGENLQALRLISERFYESVGCVYIDPPYNTGGDGFAYKDCYQHSSWLTMTADRLRKTEQLLSPVGSLFMSLDDHEAAAATTSASGALRRLRHCTNIIWQKVDSPNDNKVPLTPDHEYLLCFSPGGGTEEFSPMVDSRILDAYRVDGTTGDRFRDRLLKKNGANSRRVDRPTMYFAVAAPDGTSVFPMHDDGEEACWSLGRPTVERLNSEGKLIWKRRGAAGRERWEPYTREFAPDVPLRPYPTIWLDVKTMRQSKAQLRDLFATSATVETVKPTQLIERVISLSRTPAESPILDFFAGSGTTGHAVLNLNREDNGSRKFILVEVNDYFDTVLLPRILKATYSKDWKDGKPVDRTPVPGGALYKVLYLESYEDTLANITLPPAPSDNLLPWHLRAEYTVRYMLDHETRAAVLDLDRFRKPFGWTMEVRRGGLVTRDHPVDLVETFNYLIGLHVSRYGYFRDVNRIRYVEGVVKEDGNDRRVLVLWRDCDLVPDDELVRLFDDREFAPVSSREYDRIYVNGDPPLANIKRPDEQWKVLAIEDEFKRLSFADDEA